MFNPLAPEGIEGYRIQKHYSGCYYGASLKAIIRLLEKKGYDFVGTNKLNFNAFFVESDLLNNLEKFNFSLKSSMAA